MGQAVAELGIGLGGVAGGVGLTVGSIGTLTIFGVSMSALSAVLVGHGALVLAAVGARSLINPLPPMNFAAMNGGGGGSGLTKYNYRDKFYEKYPSAPENYQIHHRIPQKARDLGLIPSSVVDNLSNLRAVDPTIHPLITNEWRIFWAENPYATSLDVLNFADRIDNVYGQYFWSP